jgi:hypothetical protein
VIPALPHFTIAGPGTHHSCIPAQSALSISPHPHRSPSHSTPRGSLPWATPPTPPISLTQTTTVLAFSPHFQLSPILSQLDMATCNTTPLPHFIHTRNADGRSALSLTHVRTHCFPPPPCFPISQRPRLFLLDTDPHNAHTLALHFPHLATLDTNAHNAHIPIPISPQGRRSHSHSTPRCMPCSSPGSHGHQPSPVPPTELATTTMAHKSWYEVDE